MVGNSSIYGDIFGPKDRPLIIVIHGFPGSKTDSLYVAAAKHFLACGYSVFLYDLYGRKRGARNFMKCTIASFAMDLDAIIRYFKTNGAPKTYVVGHSLGGPIVLSSKEQGFAKAVLWDPSYDLSLTTPLRGARPTIYLKHRRAYLVRWGQDLIVGEALVHELDTFPWKTIAKKFTRPFKVFIAGRGVLHAAKRYVTSSPKGNRTTTIKDADHDFANTTHQKELFEKTADWFDV